jgi:hypothetical protein
MFSLLSGKNIGEKPISATEQIIVQKLKLRLTLDILVRLVVIARLLCKFGQKGSGLCWWFSEKTLKCIGNNFFKDVESTNPRGQV